MTKKYLSKRTRTKHTYEFYKQRRNSPQWRDDFLEVRKKRRIEITIQILTILVVAGGAFYFFKKDHNILQKPSEVETSTTTSSSVASTSQSDDETNSSVNSNQDESTGNDDSQVSSNYKSSRIESSSDTHSSGIEQYRIRDYTDQAYSDVSRTLRQKGLTVKRQYENSDTVAAGLIMDQDIDAGKSVVPSKTTIILTVSSGKPSFALRNLSDYTQQAVQDYAAEAGLTVSFTEEYSNSIQAGLVIRQAPDGGATMQTGDHISVVLSKGPRETTEK